MQRCFWHSFYPVNHWVSPNHWLTNFLIFFSDGMVCLLLVSFQNLCWHQTYHLIRVAVLIFGDLSRFFYTLFQVVIWTVKQSKRDLSTLAMIILKLKVAWYKKFICLFSKQGIISNICFQIYHLMKEDPHRFWYTETKFGIKNGLRPTGSKVFQN